MKNWTNMYYILHNLMLNIKSINLNKITPQIIESCYINGKNNRELYYIIFICRFESYSNEIESNRENKIVHTNRIILNIIVRTRIITELNIQYCME